MSATEDVVDSAHSASKRQKLDLPEDSEPEIASLDKNGVAEEGTENGDADKKKISNGINSSSAVKNVIEDNKWFVSTLDDKKEKCEAAKKCWENAEEFDDQGLKLCPEPFKHGEIADFVGNQDFVHEFVKLFPKLEFHEKASDLFQFNQSDDLNSVVDPHVFAISEYLKEKVLPFLKNVTGLPLNQTIDMFLSIYRQTDFLLCHDDELDSRRIAFIWYLSEDWKEEYGGTLDLYSSTDAFHPDKIQKKVVPGFNKFVFFEVGVTSFHQVSEVLKEGKERLALSGWFYGEPLPRPTVEFPVDKSANVMECALDVNGAFKRFCADMYLNAEIYSEINEQLAEESEVLVPGFFRDETYESICKSIVDLDVSDPLFVTRGPANIAQFGEAVVGPPTSPSASASSSADTVVPLPTVEALKEFFYSKEFLQFMEQITEFPFTTSDTNRVVSSLQKFSHGCYSLLRTGGTKQTGNKPIPEDIADEVEEDPNLVDVMFYFANNWEESRGGSLIYLTTEGDQLITVPPEGNCLAVVVRSPNVNSYTNYVNCLAKDDVYFVYKMTFAFDGAI